MKDLYFVSKDYVDKKSSKAISINIKSEAELNEAVNDNQGRMLFLVPENEIVINGITIYAWSHIFIPYASNHDMTGIIIYPSVGDFWLIGHTTQKGWYINKII